MPDCQRKLLFSFNSIKVRLKASETGANIRIKTVQTKKLTVLLTNI